MYKIQTTWRIIKCPEVDVSGTRVLSRRKKRLDTTRKVSNHILNFNCNDSVQLATFFNYTTMKFVTNEVVPFRRNSAFKTKRLLYGIFFNWANARLIACYSITTFIFYFNRFKCYTLKCYTLKCYKFHK